MIQRYEFRCLGMLGALYEPGTDEEINTKNGALFVSHEDFAALLAKLEIAKKALNEIQVNGDEESYAIAWKALDDIREPVDVPTGTQDHFELYP